MPNRLRIPARRAAIGGTVVAATAAATVIVTLTLLATGEVTELRAAWLLAGTLFVGTTAAGIVMCERRAHRDPKTPLVDPETVAAVQRLARHVTRVD